MPDTVTRFAPVHCSVFVTMQVFTKSQLVAKSWLVTTPIQIGTRTTRPRQRGRLYTGTVGARGYGGVVGHLATWQGN